MSASVITFAVQLGSDGFDIARAVAEKLDYRYYDYEITSEAARLVGVSPETIAQAERRPSFIERMLERLAMATAVSDGVVPGSATNPSVLTMTSSDYRQIIERVLVELANQGGCVIVGHAGQAILKNRKHGVLKVFVHGSKDRRAERVMKEMSVDMTEAMRQVKENDKQRAGFFKDAYDIDWLDSLHYDLTLNTDEVEPEVAVSLVLTSAAAFA